MRINFYYFSSHQGYSDGSETVRFVQAFEEYFSRLRPTLQRSEIEDRRAFHVNLKVLLEDEPVKEKIQELSDLVLNSPQRIISCLGLALHQVIHNLAL